MTSVDTQSFIISIPYLFPASGTLLSVISPCQRTMVNLLSFIRPNPSFTYKQKLYHSIDIHPHPSSAFQLPCIPNSQSREAKKGRIEFKLYLERSFFFCRLHHHHHHHHHQLPPLTPSIHNPHISLCINIFLSHDVIILIQKP